MVKKKPKAEEETGLVTESEVREHKPEDASEDDMRYIG